MEGRRVLGRKTTWAAALTLVGVLIGLLCLAPAKSTWADTSVQQICQPPQPGCTVFDDACQCMVACQAHCPPGGNATEVPPPPSGTQPPPPPGGTPHPQPTVVPPPGAPPSGRYMTTCGFVGSMCSTSYAVTSYYVAPDGNVYLVNYSCVNSCPTSQPQPTPVPTAYPCHQPPVPNDEGITQPCVSQWPGYDLSVAVKIPPVNAARNPWPRSLVGLSTQFCFVSAPDSAEKFSDDKAVPCRVNRGGHDDSTFNCGSPTDDVGEGTRVNYQLGVAWRRFTGNDPGYGTKPPFRAAFNLEDRAWNGGAQLIPIDPGQCFSHQYATSSWGLPQIGETWNPECQDRDCAYTERTLPVNRSCEACSACQCEGCTEAYRAFVQTWWWPEWTWRYDEYQCAHQKEECVAAPTGRAACDSSGDGVPDTNTKKVKTCDRWQWVNITEPWHLYDVRQQGRPLPYIGSAKTNMAGMDPDRNVRTPFSYSPAVPVIEVQPVHP